ncbi:hypothetical protein OS188_06020 [Xanthomarina sp. F1114]|uniref:hypothetical protein n=1 Tax=Xanthomarina sp. F1114 TaxID=2996019 RepID=UPI00225E6432|nr:hypothetical protein [Xanthomarina sp. F1114]MCX7547508.1 hypothetical protein [Xanthomarina sp. F1114]
MNAFAQFENEAAHYIELRSVEIDDNLRSRTMTKKVEFDSIKVRSICYPNKIRNKIKFKESGNKIIADFYLEAHEIILIRTFDKSKKFNSTKEAAFYFEEGKLINQIFLITNPAAFQGDIIQQPLDKTLGFNENLTSEYLIQLSKNIYDKIIE